jgi:hypothetical protein
MTTWAHSERAVAGFVCGDGYIFLKKNTNGSITPQLKIGQSETNVQNLLDVRDVYGGHLNKSQSATDTAEACFEWSVTGKDALEFMKLIRDHCLKTSKRDQIDAILSLDWVHLRSVSSDDRDAVVGARNSARSAIAEMKRNDNDDPVPAGAMNDEFIAGFFTAEGSITLTGVASMTVGFSQKNNAILCAIQDHLGGIGNLSESGLLIGNAFGKARSLLERIAPHVGPTKRRQIDIALNLAPENKIESIAAMTALKGAQGVVHKKNAKGGVYEKKEHGVAVGFVAKLRDHQRSFTMSSKTLEEKRELAEEALAEFSKLPWDKPAEPKNRTYNRRAVDAPRLPTRLELVKRILVYPVENIGAADRKGLPRGSKPQRLEGPPQLFIGGAKEIEEYFAKDGVVVCHSKIAAILRGKRHHTGGYTFELSPL